MTIGLGRHYSVVTFEARQVERAWPDLRHSQRCRILLASTPGGNCCGLGLAGLVLDREDRGQPKLDSTGYILFRANTYISCGKLSLLGGQAIADLGDDSRGVAKPENLVPFSDAIKAAR